MMIRDEELRNNIRKVILVEPLLRTADIDVFVTGNHVTLRGVVDSPDQREEAVKATWNAPGVTRVLNKLNVLRK